jgi:hypothetical protein
MGRNPRLFAHSVQSPDSQFVGPRPEIAESLRLLSAEIPVLRRSSAETGLISSADLRRTTKIPVAAIVVSESRTAGSLSGRSFRPWISQRAYFFVRVTPKNSISGKATGYGMKPRRSPAFACGPANQVNEMAPATCGGGSLLSKTTI